MLVNLTHVIYGYYIFCLYLLFIFASVAHNNIAKNETPALHWYISTIIASSILKMSYNLILQISRLSLDHETNANFTQLVVYLSLVLINSYNVQSFFVAVSTS